MKILHTSDWHIGKKVNEFSMFENQEFVFEQIYEIIRNEKIDVLIVAGDLYDKPIVDVNSINFLNSILVKIVKEFGINVILISGNHDSPDRISFGKEFFENSGIYIEGKFSGKINKIIFQDEFGDINFYPLSYFDEVYIRHLYDDQSIKTSDDALKSILGNLEIDYSKRNIFIGHGYFSNKNGEQMIESDSERRLSIGGQEVMDASILKNFDYVALGHLHAPQKILENHIRYSGSIVKYSFSEMNHKKSVTIIEILEKGNLNIRQIELKPKYEMREIEGHLDFLLSEKFYENLNTEDYYRIILHDSIGLSDPVSRLRKIYKNVMEVRFRDVENSVNSKYEGNYENLDLSSPFKLFKDFYNFASEKELNEAQFKIVEDVIKDLEGDIEWFQYV